MEYKYENGHIIPINNSISNKRLDRLEEVVKTLSPEGGVLTKEDIAEVAVKAENALKTANATSNELSIFKTNVSNTYATQQSLSTKQQELTLTVLDNGNIRIGNLQGQTKEFMPATPSGDPMHYAYVVAGAEYNDTGADITRMGVFGDAITWKAGYWWLNELGDISNEEMKYIYLYRYTAPSAKQMQGYFSACRHTKVRTPMIEVPVQASAIDASYFASSTGFKTIAVTQKKDLVLFSNIASFISYSQGVKKIINGLNLTYVKTESSIKEAFYNANSLEEVRLYMLQVSVAFEQSKNLSNASILCMIENEIAGKTITITLHANAYARAMADSSIQAALTAHPNVSLASA